MIKIFKKQGGVETPPDYKRKNNIERFKLALVHMRKSLLITTSNFFWQ
jgi:hypothetical protein